MTRPRLKKYLGKDGLVVVGTVSKCENGKLLLKNIKRDGSAKVLAEHAWINRSHAFTLFKEGDTIKFRTTVIKYERADGTTDYGLSIVRSPSIVDDRIDKAVKQTKANAYQKYKRMTGRRK